MFEVFLSNNAHKSLKNLDKELAEKIRPALAMLETTPLPLKEYDLKKLSGTENFYRIRVSNHRIIYSVDWKGRTINVLKIERRDDSTYNKL